MIRTAVLGLTLSLTVFFLTPGHASAQDYSNGLGSDSQHAQYSPGYYWPNIYGLPSSSNFVSPGYYSPAGGSYPSNTGYFRSSYYFYSSPAYIHSTPGYYHPVSGYGPIPRAIVTSTPVSHSPNADKVQQTASVKVLLPTADAEVWLSGSRGTLRGAERLFSSPALEPGREYTYTVRVRWTIDGRVLESVRAVDVRAGETSAVDFRTPAGESIPIPPKVK